MGRQRSLEHTFRIVAFDWDGTAVTSRHEDVSALRRSVESLLRLGVWIVVITGTKFANIDRQLSAAVVGPHKQRLYVCSNRGSEVYGFDHRSQPVLLWRRVATPQENRQLTEIADSVRSSLQARTSLDVRVVSNRLNRRKIDLIPLPQWQEPPKATLGALLQAVEERLQKEGISGGLREVFELTTKLAVEKGLREARITSDVKHVEIGLTDKSDSIRWMTHEVAAKNGIPAGDILIGGDEFGPMAGCEGSDHKMVAVAPPGTVFVSVGPEPGGAPQNVIHLGGGPARFLDLLAEQIRLHEGDVAAGGTESRLEEEGPAPLPGVVGVPTPTETPSSAGTPTPANANQGWLLIEEGFEPAREHEIESLFTVANGYIGTRGSLQERTSVSQPATLVAGVFITPPGSTPQLMLAPDWARFRVFVDGDELRLDKGDVLEHRRVLDARRGVLSRMWRHRDDLGRITEVRYQRFASLCDRHALVEWATVVPENHGGRLRVESLVDTTLAAGAGVVNVTVTEAASTRRKRRSTSSASETNGTPVLVVRAAGLQAAVAYAMTSLPHTLEERETAILHTRLTGKDRMGEAWEWSSEIGTSYRLDKLMAVYSTRDVRDPGREAAQHLSQLIERGADGLLFDSARAWGDRYATADVELVGDPDAQRAIRFAIYHLIAAANPEDEYVSIGARGLTGEAYKGHVFWETEIYMLPFYVFTHPLSARTLLMYRYHTLPQAREKASAMGCQGALYAWESTSTGEEATPPFALAPDGEVIPILAGRLEQHIGADIAYAVWQYWLATGDDDFFLRAGAEIVLETARFWASRVEGGEDGFYHILQVVGPDEYHESVDDDAYTNGMAQWNLERAAETARLLRERWPEYWQDLSKRLQIAAGDADRWVAIASTMYTGFDPATGLIEQFRGYFDLEHVNLAAYEPRTAPMDVLLGHERIARTQIIKQPDVVMLIYLLCERFSPEVREVNFRYYEPRCGHGSSLSPSIHAALAARLGYRDLAERYFRQAGEIDLANNMGNAAGGIHMGAQGGLWQAALFGFAGVRLREDGLAFDPHLPASWQTLSLPVAWHGRQLRVTATASPPTLEVILQRGQPMTVAAGSDEGAQVQVDTAGAYRTTGVAGYWRPWQEAPP